MSKRYLVLMLTVLLLTPGIMFFQTAPLAAVNGTSGSIEGWGNNDYGVRDVPAGSDFTAISAGYDHCLALRSNGSIVGWGDDSHSAIDAPSGNGFIAVSAGQDFSIAIKADGSLLGWGTNGMGQIDVPPGNGYIAIDAGVFHSLALKADGSVVGWGNNGSGQSDSPPGNDYVAVSASGNYSLALKSDGTIVGWGNSSYGTLDIPPGSDYTAISASDKHCLALKSDGSIISWGYYGRGDDHEAPGGNHYTAIAAGGDFDVALAIGGLVVAWGYNSYRLLETPPEADHVAISAGEEYCLALRASNTASEWYLAEGSTGGDMETWVLVQNPNDGEVSVAVDFMTDEGLVEGPRQKIPGDSRRSYNVKEYVTTYNVSTKVTSSDFVICERAMYGNGRTWAHDSIGATTLSSRWYLAEGCTEGGMETWVLVQNPNDDAVKIDMSFQTDEGELPGPKRTIPPNSRRSYNVGDFCTSYDVSTEVNSSGGGIICERAMYGNNRTWAHDSIGVTRPQPAWILAEGCTAGGMETWILIQNPTPFPITTEIYFITDTGVYEGPSLGVLAYSRESLDVGKYVESFDVSTVVYAKYDEIICERAMYGNNRTWGHDSIGVPYTANAWCMAEGCTAGGFETWVLVANVSDRPTQMEMFFMTKDGLVNGPAEELPPFSRSSYNVGEYVTTYDVSTLVVSDEPNIVCERAVYGNGRIWGHDSIGFSPAAAFAGIAGLREPASFANER